MRPVTLLPIHVEQVTAAGPATLIDRYLDRDDRALRLHYRTGAMPFDLSLRLIDTSRDRAALRTRSGEAAIWHVLWVRDETGGAVDITTTAGVGRWAIVPGDSIAVPPGGSLRAEGGQLAMAITVPGATAPLSPPTHGSDRFDGYNRQTVTFQLGDIRLCRWKLTQPLALAAHHPTPLVVMALARAVVIRTETSIDQLAQGQAALIDPAADPVVLPDGLGYLLTIDSRA